MLQKEKSSRASHVVRGVTWDEKQAYIKCEFAASHACRPITLLSDFFPSYRQGDMSMCAACT